LVFKGLRQKLLRTKAKLKGMSVTEYKKHMAETSKNKG